MPKIPTQVAENRESTRRLDGQFVDLPETPQIDLSFARNEIEVAVDSIEVYTRPLNDGLISGHPAGSTHGSGHGVAGEVSGAWSQQSVTVNSKEFVRSGRNALRDALDGQSGGTIREIAVGTGTAEASVGDTALGSETGRSIAYGVKDAATKVRARANFGFSEDGLAGSDATEFGLFSKSGDLIARVVTDPITVTEEEELRVDITLTVTGTGVGNSVITTKGEERITDAIRDPGTAIGLNEIAFGTGSTDPSKSDTALATESFRKAAQRDLSNERIEASVRVDSSEPASQPETLTEIGVFDNASSANLLWRTVFDGRFKDDSYGFTATVGFRIV